MHVCQTNNCNFAFGFWTDPSTTSHGMERGFSRHTYGVVYYSSWGNKLLPGQASQRERERGSESERERVGNNHRHDKGIVGNKK
jgi:hypothetical protein